jgi:GNAT superfamily N-acetyltransferase
MEISIRQVQLTDAEAIARLSGQLGYPITVAATLQNLGVIISQSNEIVFVAIHEGELVGWIYAFEVTRLESGKFCEIGGLIVDEQYRGKAIGKLLLHEVESWCKARSCFTLRVRSNVKRDDAHRFYTRLGFNETKQQKIFEMKLAGGV